MSADSSRNFATVSKDALRKLVPEYLRKQRNVIIGLGPKAGPIYARLRLLDTIGIRAANRRRAPVAARSFLFVCFGNIMRSALAESLLKRALSESGRADEVRVMSAGLHATSGNEAHPWAQEAAQDLGISLSAHRAKPLTSEMVAKADCILAMDFRNKAELLVLYPESSGKIYLLGAYADAPLRGREIQDPYHQDLAATQLCARQLQTCIQNLMMSSFR